MSTHHRVSRGAGRALVLGVCLGSGLAVAARTAADEQSSRPTVALSVNGQHPASGVVETAGRVTLVADCPPNDYEGGLNWYWAFALNGQLYWVTDDGITTTPGPLQTNIPSSAFHLTMLDVVLPPDTTMVNLVIATSAGPATLDSVITADAITAVVQSQ